MLFTTAVANAGVGRVLVKPLGRINRKPSVSTKKNVLSFLIGPPSEDAHWFAFENGRGVIGLELLNIQSLEFMVRPFHQYRALP